jgi:hypothetical protein
MKAIKTIIYTLLLITANAAVATNYPIPHTQIDKFTVTYTKNELYNSTTGKWLTLNDTTHVINIANASPSEVASLISTNVILTYGTYTKFKSTIDNEVTLKACGLEDSACTDGNVSASAKYSHSLAAAPLANTTTSDFTFIFDFDNYPSILAANGAVSINDGAAMEVTYTLTSPFIMNAETTSMSIDSVWDLNNVFTYNDFSSSISVDFMPTSITVQ